MNILQSLKHNFRRFSIQSRINLKSKDENVSKTMKREWEKIVLFVSPSMSVSHHHHLAHRLFSLNILWNVLVSVCFLCHGDVNRNLISTLVWYDIFFLLDFLFFVLFFLHNIVCPISFGFLKGTSTSTMKISHHSRNASKLFIDVLFVELMEMHW